MTDKLLNFICITGLIFILSITTIGATENWIYREHPVGTSVCSEGGDIDPSGYCQCPAGFFDDNEYCRKTLSMETYPENRQCPSSYLRIENKGFLTSEGNVCIYNSSVDRNFIPILKRDKVNGVCPEGMVEGGEIENPRLCACPFNYEVDERYENRCKKFFYRSRLGCQYTRDEGKCACPENYVPQGDRCTYDVAQYRLRYKCVLSRLAGTGEARYTIQRENADGTLGDYVFNYTWEDPQAGAEELENLKRDGLCNNLSENRIPEFERGIVGTISNEEGPSQNNSSSSPNGVDSL